MKLRHLLLLLLAPAAVFAAAAANPSVEFDGVLVESSGKVKVSLLNLTTGESKWVSVPGGTFGTFTATSYTPDAKNGDVVVLTKTGSSQTLRVVLKNSTIIAAAEQAAATPTTAAQKTAVTNNLRMLAQAAEQYFLENGVDSVTTDKLIGATPQSYIKNLPSVAGENYNGLAIRQGYPIRVTLADGTVISYSP